MVLTKEKYYIKYILVILSSPLIFAENNFKIITLTISLIF